ncbi:MAG: hypothetical protein IJ644_08340 [Oscillospiraceae bacterium]|nr:hypothetical protein [Oscillospiraceae bacterium]
MKNSIPVRFLTAEDYYSVFSPEYAERNDKETDAKRKAIEAKMRQIHEILYPQIKPLGYACHYRKQNITTAITPNPHNGYYIGWLGVKYVKGMPEEDRDLFHKFACMQFGLSDDGFSVCMYLAVPDSAMDRKKLAKLNYMGLERRRAEIDKALCQVQNEGCEWQVGYDKAECYPIQEDTVSGFCDWFKQHDKDGQESYLRKRLAPDIILKSPAVIAGEIRRVIVNMHPLYGAMTGR